MVAYDQFGDGPPSSRLTVLTLRHPIPELPVPEVEETWVFIHDSTTTVVGQTANIPPNPLTRNPTGLAYGAHTSEAYFDTSGDGLLETWRTGPLSESLTFPLVMRQRPANASGRTYESLAGARFFRTHRGTQANIVVVAVLPPTAGSRGLDSYVSLHIAWDAGARTYELVDFRGGDWTTDDGKTMVTAEFIDISLAGTPTLPGPQGAGVIRGTARARLMTYETFSYFASPTSPAHGYIRYISDVEFSFAAPVYSDEP